MEESISIQSVRDSTRLSFSDVDGDSFTASLISSHFSGRVVVSTYCSGPPSLLFEELAREWRGWENAKTWAALEDELTLAATSDRIGHVTLLVIMRNYTDAANWRLEADLHLEAGQLARLAQEVNRVFSEVRSPEFGL